MALLTSFWLYDLFLTIFGVIGTWYIYTVTVKYKYWAKKGIPVANSVKFPVGNFSGVNSTRSLMTILLELYNEMDHVKYFGGYMFSRPVFIVRDLDLIKNMLVKDFSSFHDRGFDLATDKEPLTGHLFLLKGQEWRNLRVKLTPTFTSGKMKMMFSTLVEVGKELGDVFEECAKQPEMDVKDVLGRYSIDVISSCAFGIVSNSLKNPDAEFSKMARDISNPSASQIFIATLMFFMPKLFSKLPLNVFPKRMTDFFVGIVRDTMKYRTDHNIKRNDFLQLMMQLKNHGYIPEADTSITQEAPRDAQKFTVEQAAAQAFLFFFAGYETSSAALQFAFYELALNPDLQDQLRKELDYFKNKHGGQITYDMLNEMNLLDRVVAETLRKYPVGGVLMRESTVEYPIEGTKVVLDKKTNLMIPVLGIHRDPKYYPNPNKFDPDRFLPEQKANRHPYAYLPFGEGPRNCIGNRFALMQVKVGLCVMLSEFEVSPSAKTPTSIQFHPRSDVLIPKDTLYLKISHRKD